MLFYILVSRLQAGSICSALTWWYWGDEQCFHFLQTGGQKLQTRFQRKREIPLDVALFSINSKKAFGLRRGFHLCHKTQTALTVDLSGTFSHLHTGALELSQINPRVPGHVCHRECPPQIAQFGWLTNSGRSLSFQNHGGHCALGNSGGGGHFCILKLPDFVSDIYY